MNDSDGTAIKLRLTAVAADVDSDVILTTARRVAEVFDFELGVAHHRLGFLDPDNTGGEIARLNRVFHEGHVCALPDGSHVEHEYTSQADDVVRAATWVAGDADDPARRAFLLAFGHLLDHVLRTHFTGAMARLENRQWLPADVLDQSFPMAHPTMVDAVEAVAGAWPMFRVDRPQPVASEEAGR